MLKIRKFSFLNKKEKSLTFSGKFFNKRPQNRSIQLELYKEILAKTIFNFGLM